ncbi:MAG TPA: hypothetical protein VN702_01060 [Acetobacteraceae bacterium]|nr:hypothetical protein [Acetobacteraceae bacterium]
MGQVIRLVFPDSGYPATMQELDTAECVFLLAVRWWVADHREDIDPLPRLCDAMAIAGTPDAAFLVDRLMAALARATRRTILIHCPHCPQVGEDEKHLLHAASLVQAGESARAERALRIALLSAPGADCTLGSLESLAEMFASARLMFQRRKAPSMTLADDQTAKLHVHAALPHSIH